MILTADYFTKEPIRINGIDALTFDGASDSANEIKNDIESYIAIYEPEFLRAVLGDTYKAILQDDEALKSELFNAIDNVSPCASFVYYKYWSEQMAVNTMSGDEVIISTGSTAVVNITKLVNVWNRMSDEVKRILLETDNTSVSPNFEHDIFYKLNTVGL